MEAQIEKILVHDGVQIFTQSAWTATYQVETKIFLLVGLREKEILSAMQTTEKDLISDIENFNLYYPWNTKIVGLYIQFTGTKPANHLDILDQTLQHAQYHKLLLLGNFFYTLADQKTVIGTGVSFDSILQSYEYQLISYGSNNKDRNQWWDNRKMISPDFEVSDLKRDQVVNNFFYIQIRQTFEGFDDELEYQQQQFLENLENPKDLIMIFRQLGNDGLIQPYQSMSEEFGKRLNIEARKLIKTNKDKQQSYNLVKLELMTLPNDEKNTRCPSYQLSHNEKNDLRKIDVSLIGIFSTSDNLHDQLDLFMKHSRKQLKSIIYPLSQNNNIQLIQYNLRESALLLNTVYKFPKSQFSNGSLNTQQFVEQRLKYNQIYSYQQNSPRLMCQNSIQSLGEVEYDRPLLIHSSLLKKSNFESNQSFKYCVTGDYLYYHYMQDGFNDNGWGCAYRSLQTLISHFKYEGYAPRNDVPSHKEIQQALVSMEDKEKDMIGSSQWIGAFEVNLCMDYFLKAECKIMNVSSGLELQTKARELRDHFIHHGTPIMIGGDLYAHTIIGIDFCEELDDVRFLILDPHYPGGDNNIKNILQKGWCAWKDVTMFKADTFYNLCMPLRPTDV